MTLCITSHARARMQQRGIRTEALAALLEAGTANPAPGGCEILFFDKIERERLGRITRAARGRDRLHGLYAVTDDSGTIITVGHRYRRIARSG
jgi:hypothetical protein